jgi:hypothetical protein
MRYPGRRTRRILVGIVAGGAVLAAGLAGSGGAAATPPGGSAARSQPSILASSTSPHAINPSEYVQLPGHNGAASPSIAVFRVPRGTGELLNGIHACRALGNDESTQGVYCADLFAEDDGHGGVIVVSAAEGFCQTLTNPNNFPRCADMQINLGVNTPGRSSTIAHDSCGHQFGLCDIPRQFFEGDDLDITTPCNTSVGGPNEAWTTIQGGSSIELPISSDTRTLSANLSSQHAIVCLA